VRVRFPRIPTSDEVGMRNNLTRTDFGDLWAPRIRIIASQRVYDA